MSAVQEAIDETKKLNSFAIYHPSKRNFFLYATTSKECQEWMNEINNLIDQLQKGGTL